MLFIIIITFGVIEIITTFIFILERNIIFVFMIKKGVPISNFKIYYK